MKSRRKLEKFGSIALGVVCIFLAFKLISEISGSPVEAAREQEAAKGPSGASNKTAKTADKLASTDPNLDLQALKKYVARPLPGNLRDPFDFAAPPPPKNVRGGIGGRPGGAGGVGGSAGPPPMQISLRAIGYSLRQGLGGEAYLTDADQVYIVHRGNVVMGHFVIARITPSVVEVQDESSGQSVQLPIPKVQ